MMHDERGGGNMTGVVGWVAAGATRVYERPARDQLFLLPVSMREWLEEGHLAWFVLDVVARMDTQRRCIVVRVVRWAVRRMSRR